MAADMVGRGRRGYTGTARNPVADDITAYESGWQIDDRPAFEDREPEILVSRSLRLAVATYEEVRRIASAQGVSPSTLMRRWIEDGVALAQEETGRP